MATYLNKVTLKESKFGIKFSGKTDEVIAQLLAITNEKGYFNLEIQKRKQVGNYGETHYVKVDEWKPEQKTDSMQDKNNPLNNHFPAVEDFPF